ncbi:MAG: alkaline shock response membrane anchor protein AmaP [Actinomycetota bacterium]|nr:alkaline shock response membrane anchor protein AmaP [Actinomycetota bacterium]MDQ3575274.1 alkaline shock response membrane anchor protein AmaP [Actinomycetota bacterium]
MRRGPDRLNRWALVVVSLVLLGAGGYGLARGYDALGAEAGDEALLAEPVRDFVGRNENVFWAVVFVVCLIVALIAVRWILAQFRSPRLTELDLTEDGSRGTTHMRASGASQALATDIEDYFGVSSASARLVQDGARPEVDLRVDVNDDADVPALRGRIEEHALTRFCQALEVSDVDARLHLRLTGPTQRVVR